MLLKTLPIPKIFTLGPHAYCLPSDCLQHHLSFGHSAANFICQSSPTSYSHVKYSPHGIEISSDQSSLLSIAAIMWSDDCDPQNSKKNWKALWCLTISFIQDDDAASDSPIPTYPIAVGPKGSDHRKVLSKILDDIQNNCSSTSPLQSYIAIRQPPISVTLDIFAYLGD